MNIYTRAAIAAVLVVGVGLVAINVLPRQPDGSVVGGEPTASPSTSPPPSASPPPSRAPAVGIPELTQTFVSTNNGFSIGYPDDARIEPATVLGGGFSVEDDGETGFDLVLSDTVGSALRGASTPVPDGVSIDEWFDRLGVGYQPGGCGAPRSEQPEVTIDGQPGRIWEECPGQVEATVVAGGRLYLFTLYLEASDVRAVFDAYASTIDLRPEEAASPAP